MSERSIWELEEFKPWRARWQARGEELRRRAAYYDGSIYAGHRRRLGLLGPRLYRGVKALYLPLSRAVDVDAGIVPGGWPLAPEASRHAAGVRRVFAWSGWATDGVLFVHYGAVYGVSGLKVADLREAGRVLVKPVDPTRYMLVGMGTYDSTPQMAICVEKRTGPDGEEFEYAEVIDTERVRTFADGEPAGFDGRTPEYANALGVVPIVEVGHIETGAELGECTFQKAIPLLDEVNELASYLADIIKKHAEPQWAVLGAEPSDLVKSGDNVWFIPGAGDAKALVAPIDVAGVLSFVQEIRDQVHGSLPELAFDDLKQKTQIATATLELQLMELVLKVKRVRPNYDHGLAVALRLAGLAAATMGVGEVAGLFDEGLAFDPERPVLPLDPVTALKVERLKLDVERRRGGVGTQPEENGNDGDGADAEEGDDE